MGYIRKQAFVVPKSKLRSVLDSRTLFLLIVIEICFLRPNFHLSNDARRLCMRISTFYIDLILNDWFNIIS